MMAAAFGSGNAFPMERARVLVVDDSRVIRAVVKGCLRSTGYAVDEAGDGAAALELCDRHGYDVVVSDLAMPGMDGLGLLQALGRRADRPYATFYLGFTSTERDVPALTDWLSRTIQPQLATLEGVQRVTNNEGGRPIAMRVWIDPDRLAALNLSPGDVHAALQRNNYLAAVGQTKGNQVQVNLLANTDLRSVDEFADLIVADREGAIVRLSDVARVELGAEEATVVAKYNEKEGVYLGVWPLVGANEIEVARPTRVALPAGGKVSHLTLAYAERAIDPQPALFDPPAADEMSIQYRRIEEGCVLALEPADPTRRHLGSPRRSDPCGRAHPIAIARLVRVGSRWRLDRRFRPGRARS